MKQNKECWTQFLNFENTTSRYRICRKIGHLKNTCSVVKEEPRRIKKLGQNPKGWKFPEHQSEDEEDEEEIGPPNNDVTQNPQESGENGGENHETTSNPIPTLQPKRSIKKKRREDLNKTTFPKFWIPIRNIQGYLKRPG